MYKIVVLCVLTGHTCIFITRGLELPFRLHDEQEDYICCVPSDWVGLMYLDFGTVFIDENGGTAYSYINGTVHAAYSYTRKKAYFKQTGVEQSPLIPKPVPYDTTILYDYQHRVMYSVNGAGDCDKDELDNMTRQCIPGTAKLISSGSLSAGGLPISTYRFTTQSDIMWEITATVVIQDLHPFEPRRCTPVELVYFTPSVNPDSGSYYTLQVTDVSPLNDTNIFDVPKQCL